MVDVSVKGRTLPDAYHKALEALQRAGEIVPCPAWNTECLELSITIHVKEPDAEPKISKLFYGGPRDLAQYKLEFVHGILDGAVATGLEPYTYHARFAEQLARCVQLLKDDPYTRRATLTVARVSDLDLPDPPCLQQIQFFIRHGALDCEATFRSNDAIRAGFLNMYGIIELQKYVAKYLGVPVGTYTHRARSWHVYQNCYAELASAVKRIMHCPRGKASHDLTYNFKGDWDELVRAEYPKVLAAFQELAAQGSIEQTREPADLS